MHLSLIDVTLSLSLVTAAGTIKAKLFIPRQQDVFALELASSDNDVLQFSNFHPGVAVPGTFDSIQNRTEYRLNPEPILETQDGVTRCTQELLTGGGYCTAWNALQAQAKQTIFIGVGYGKDRRAAQFEAAQRIEKGKQTPRARLKAAHANWWRTYFKASSFAIPDKKLEIFCLRQLYKFACASRFDGPVISVAGPWMQPSGWAGIWWNMNIQPAYRIATPSNHPELNEPLLRSLEAHEENLRLHVPPRYREDSIDLGRASAPDLRADVESEMHNLPWVLHNCHLPYLYTQDETILRRLYPFLKKSIRLILHHVTREEHPDGDHRYHLARQGRG